MGHKKHIPGGPGTELYGSPFGRRLRDMFARRDPRLSMTLRVAWGDGWEKGTLGDMLNLTRQAVQNRVRNAKFYPVEELSEIPAPPVRLPRRRPKKFRVPPMEVAPDIAAELRALSLLARRVHAFLPVDAPERAASTELSERLVMLKKEGFGNRALGTAIGQTGMAVTLRLARYEREMRERS